MGKEMLLYLEYSVSKGSLVTFLTLYLPLGDREKGSERTTIQVMDVFQKALGHFGTH